MASVVSRVLMFFCTAGLACSSPASGISNGYYQSSIARRDVTSPAPPKPSTISAGVKPTGLGVSQKKARGESWDNQGVEPFPTFSSDDELSAIVDSLGDGAGVVEGRDQRLQIPGASFGSLRAADAYDSGLESAAADSQPYFSGAAGGVAKTEAYNGRPEYSQGFAPPPGFVGPPEAIESFSRSPEFNGAFVRPPGQSRQYQQRPKSHDIGPGLTEAFGKGSKFRAEFGTDLKHVGGFNRDVNSNGTLEMDLEDLEELHGEVNPWGHFEAKSEPTVHFRLPIELPCKGNCPLKNKLLPKYTPDDDGKLRCPEDNGKHYRSKQGNALFQIVCYADYLGRELISETETSLDACIDTCTRVQQCRAVVFTPNEIDGPCVLKFNEGRTHVNPFVMSARLVSSECASGRRNEACERHNRVWEMEQEEARQERHRMHMEETRAKIEALRKERAWLEKSRHLNRLDGHKAKLLEQGIAHSNSRDKARYDAYVASEEDFRLKKLREQKEAQRDREREQRRFNWKMAVEERERERLRHQVEREREALEAEVDRLREQEWSDDEAWWTTDRREHARGKGRFEISPAAQQAGFQDYVPDKLAGGGPGRCLGEKRPGAEFASGGASPASVVAAGVPTAGALAPQGSPADDGWRWHPDKSWKGYWDVEGTEREMSEGWDSEDD